MTGWLLGNIGDYLMLINSWESVGIKIRGTGQIKTKCLCSPTRKNTEEECLSINLDLGIGKCHHCQETFIIKGHPRPLQPKSQESVAPQYSEEDWQDLSAILEWFEKRGISQTTLMLNLVGGRIGNFKGKERPIASFPFYKDKLVNVGYRNLVEKEFKLQSGCEVCFYGMQNLFTEGFLNTRKLIICEGMVDCLSFYEVGFSNAISVPNGSPFAETGNSSPKLSYLEDEFFLTIEKEFDEIVIATDSDYAGNALAKELSERLGVERCSRYDFGGLKDCNDVLVERGKEAVVEGYLNRKPMLEGLVKPLEIERELLDFYSNGLQRGMLTGIEPLDEIVTWDSGLYVVHGAPSSKKTVLVDNILVGLANNHQVKTAIFSPETPTAFHIGRLCSIYTGKKIGVPEESDRMSYTEFQEAVQWVNKNFTFIQPPNNDLDSIIRLWEISIKQNGTKVCVLDPFSKVSFDGESLHNFVRTMMEKLTAFRIKYNIIVIIVAHPRKLEVMDRKDPESDYKVSQPYDIAESSNFFNSPDFILSIWTSKKYPQMPTKVFVQKSKMWHIAKDGEMCRLDYDFNSWRLGKFSRQLDSDFDL
jgi:twinkle protein